MRPVCGDLATGSGGSDTVCRWSATIRQKRARARRKAGLVSYRLDLSENDVAWALIASGRLTEETALNRAAVEAELATVITDWAARWLLARIADHKMTDLAALLPWNWRRPLLVDRAA
jgi:hypothetical protein